MSQINNIPTFKMQKHDPDKYKNVPKEYLEVAEGMESQFTNHLINEMRKSTKAPSGPAESIYRSMLDAERAKLMSQTNTGLGIKDVVLKEIYPNFDKPNLGNVKMYKEITAKEVHSTQGENNE